MICRLFLIVGIFLTLVGNSAFAAVKIGYVDMQKAIQETKTGQTAKKKLEKEFNDRKKELETKEADLKKMNDDLEKKELVLSDDVKLKKQQELQKEMLKYRELVQKSQLDIRKKEQELTMPILKKLRDIITDIAKKEEYTVILEKSEQSVLWAADDIDLTQRVIQLANK